MQTRQEIIENCLEKRKSRFDTNETLAQNKFEPLEGGEADCYDVMLNSTKSSNPRQKIIASCLIQGLSKTQANLKLYENKYRKLTSSEITDYEDVLSRVRFCGLEIQLNPKKEEYIPPREDVIKKGIINHNSTDEVNKKLSDYGYETLSNQEDCDYRERFNKFHNKRESLIQEAYQACKTVSEINKILLENNLSKLDILEEMEYQNERAAIIKKKRENVIKECLDERMSRFDADKVLEKMGFEKLGDSEGAKFMKFSSKSAHLKSAELSNQFRKLYRQAIKLYHPDRFNDAAQKSLATTRMKAINEAKDKNDFFLLKSLLEQFEKENP